MINTIATLDNTVFRVAGFCPDSLFCRRGVHYKQEQCVSLFPRPVIKFSQQMKHAQRTEKCIRLTFNSYIFMSMCIILLKKIILLLVCYIYPEGMFCSFFRMSQYGFSGVIFIFVWFL